MTERGLDFADAVRVFEGVTVEVEEQHAQGLR